MYRELKYRDLIWPPVEWVGGFLVNNGIISRVLKLCLKSVALNKMTIDAEVRTTRSP